MMYLIVGDDTLRFVIILSTGIQVSIEAREVTARNFDANSMSGVEKIAGDHRLQRHFIHFAGFHPDIWFVVSVAITHPLNRFVEIECTAIGVDVDEFDSEIRILRVRRHKKSDFYWPTDFETFSQRLGGINEDIGSRLVLALIERARCDCVSSTANIDRKSTRLNSRHGALSRMP